MSSQVSRKKRKSYGTFDLISSGTTNSTHFCVAIETSVLKEWPASARFEIKLSIDNDGFSWWVIMHKGIKGLITTETTWVQPGWMLFCSAWFPWSLWELSEIHLDSHVMRVRGVCALCSYYQVVQGKYGEYSFSQHYSSCWGTFCSNRLFQLLTDTAAWAGICNKCSVCFCGLCGLCPCPQCMSNMLRSIKMSPFPLMFAKPVLSLLSSLEVYCGTVPGTQFLSRNLWKCTTASAVVCRNLLPFLSICAQSEPVKCWRNNSYKVTSLKYFLFLFSSSPICSFLAFLFFWWW